MIALTKELKLWLVIVLIFLLGVATGVSLVMGTSAHLNRPPEEQQIKSHMLKWYTRRLDLTPDQQTKLQPIMADEANQIQALHREEAGRISQIVEKANDQIAAILTPEQQVELKKMEKEMQSDRDRMFPGHMRPGGRHGESEDGGILPPPGFHAPGPPPSSSNPAAGGSPSPTPGK